MIEVVGHTVKIHRGDAGSFRVTFDGEDAPEDGVQVLFSVKREKRTDAVPIIQKTLTVSGKTVQADLSREDTAGLEPGTYYWDVCIMWPNLPWTPMDPEAFIIKPVVHDVS